MKKLASSSIGSHNYWSFTVDVQLKQGDGVVLEQEQVNLLSAIERTQSLTAAGKELGVSYRKAWDMVRQINEKGTIPLLESSPGGASGGRTQLTAHGLHALNLYENVTREVHVASARILQKLVRPEKTTCLRIAAAISFEEALSQLIAHYTLNYPQFRARAIYGASDELVDQIQNGSHFDILIGANRETMDSVIASKNASTDNWVSLARNSLCIVGSSGFRDSELSLNNLLLNPQVKKIAVAQPQCPLGKITCRLLAKERLASKVANRLLAVDNSKAVLSAVRAGAADLGIAFSNHGKLDTHIRRIMNLDSNGFYTEYSAGILDCSLNQTQSQEFLAFLQSDVAVSVYRRCGFSI